MKSGATVLREEKAFDLALDCMRRKLSQARQGTTSYGSISQEGSERLTLGTICLASLGSIYGYRDSMHTKAASFFIFNLASDSAVTRRYLSRILDPETSPWRDLIKAQPEQDLDTVTALGYVLTNLNFPANYVVNFLTAFRFVSEYQNQKALLFDELLREGVSFGTAACTLEFLLLGGPDYKTKGMTLTAASGHYAFSSSCTTFKSIKRVNECDPDTSQYTPHLFFNNTAYLPCNIIWGPIVKGYYEEVRGLNTIKDFVREFSPAKTKRFFPDKSTSLAITYPQILDFCKAIDKKEIKIDYQ